MILDNALFILIVGGLAISAIDFFYRLRWQAHNSSANYIVNREIAGGGLET
jgi:hypothetical protein